MDFIAELLLRNTGSNQVFADELEQLDGFVFCFSQGLSSSLLSGDGFRGHSDVVVVELRRAIENCLSTSNTEYVSPVILVNNRLVCEKEDKGKRSWLPMCPRRSSHIYPASGKDSAR